MGDDYCDDGSTGADFDCAEFDYDDGDCSEDSDDDTGCSEGELADCTGACVTETWLGDDYCDDGSIGPDFDCAEFDYDDGDCAPATTCGAYTGLSFVVNEWTLIIDPEKADGSEWDWTVSGLDDLMLGALDLALSAAYPGVWLPGYAAGIKEALESVTGEWNMPDVTAYRTKYTATSPKGVVSGAPAEFDEDNAVLVFASSPVPVEFEDPTHEVEVAMYDRDFGEDDHIATWTYSAELFGTLAGCGRQSYTFSDDEMSEGGHRIRQIWFDIEAAP